MSPFDKSETLVKLPGRFCAILVVLASFAVAQLRAQDLFVLEVYRPELENAGVTELETHLNYFAIGPVVTEQHLHAALELSHVVAPGLQLGAYALGARRPGFAPEFAGWRLRSQFVAPASWHLPARLAVNAEWEHTRPLFADHQNALELVPIIGFGNSRWDLALNPGVELEFASGTHEAEMEFEPRMAFGYQAHRAVKLGLEYFGAVGEVGEFLPVVKQVHQFYPSVDLKLGDELVWNFGVGIGVTSVGNRLTLKTAIEFPLGGEEK
jgi:hypothetical protein